MTAILLVLTLSLGWAAGARADTIHLRGGRTVQADRSWAEDGTVYYRRYGGWIGIPEHDVLKIDPDSTRLPSAGAEAADAEATERDRAARCAGARNELIEIERGLAELMGRSAVDRARASRDADAPSSLGQRRGALEERRLIVRRRILRCLHARPEP